MLKEGLADTPGCIQFSISMEQTQICFPSYCSPRREVRCETFCLLWFRNMDLPAGSSFVWFAALTAGSRLFLEAFRGDSTLIFGGLRLAQVVAWAVLAIALFAGESIRQTGTSLKRDPPLS